MPTVAVHTPCDYMATAYDLIGEPLNLLAAGQRWFAQVYHRHCQPRDADGACAVLGAVSWLAALVGHAHRHTLVADSSEPMLARCAERLAAPAGAVDFVRCDWLTLPNDRTLRLVVGDNSFSFLRFPDDWRLLADALAARMEPGGLVLCRICSAPPSHRRRGTTAIAADAERAGMAINCTEVRTRLLFDQWHAATGSIRTESALDDFDRHGAVWTKVAATCALPVANDLVSIQKYRGSGATYYAPRLNDALTVLSDRFHVREVQYGPYAMSDYFPLLCLERR